MWWINDRCGSKTPLSLLSASQLDCLAGDSGEYGLNQGLLVQYPSPKKRVDRHNVLSATCMTLLGLMRNDPAILTRPVLFFLGEHKNIQSAVSTFPATHPYLQEISEVRQFI